MSTVQEQREQMIREVTATKTLLETFIVQNSKEHKALDDKLNLQNGKVAKNTEKISENRSSISKIVGYGMGIFGVMGIVIAVIGLFVRKG